MIFIHAIVYQFWIIDVKSSIIQGDQLNMDVFFWYLVKVTCQVYACTLAYTEQVISNKVPESTAMLIWSGCIMYNIRVCKIRQEYIFP